MQSWASLLACTTAVSVALALVICLQPTDIERRHARIQPGMTVSEVGEIMDTTLMDDKRPFVSPRGSFWWSVPRKFGEAPTLFLEVEFDEDGRVVRTGRATLVLSEP